MSSNVLAPNPLGIVFKLLMKHIHGEVEPKHGRKQAAVDGKCCRPYKQDEIEAEKPPESAEFLRGAKRTWRNRSRGKGIAG